MRSSERISCCFNAQIRGNNRRHMETLKTAILIIIIILSIISHSTSSSSSSSTEHGYDSIRKQFIYSLRQEDLLERERIFEGRDYHLSKREQVVDNYLQYLKWKVLRDTAGSGKYPPTRPVEEVLEEIRSSEIYRLLKLMPKGANLHTHENHQLGKLKLLELFMASDMADQLFVQHGINSSHEWKLEIHQNDPSRPELKNILKNQQNPIFSIENLAKQQTLIGAMETAQKMGKTDSGSRWDLANNVFGRGSTSLVVDENMKRNYLRAMYQQGLSEGIYYIETRKSFSRLERDLQLTKELVEEFRVENPKFLGHRRIYYSKRTDSREAIAKNLKHLSAVMKAHPDQVVGFDLVGEEDWGSSNLNHVDEFLKYVDFHGSLEHGNLTSSIPWLLHTAESNWIENVHIPLVNSDGDATPRSNNLYSAILLGAKRIGHGIGFWKHPYLLELMKRRKNVAVEVCVVSNQLLGYTPDLRHHPAQLFHKMGIPVILSPDDPGLFGYDEVTLDWYEAFMGWSGLNLGDLRQFGINSFLYSGMSEEEKTRAIDGVLGSEWKRYVDLVFRTACQRDFDDEAVKFERLFPRHVSAARVSHVHIMGFNFEAALCKKVSCRFGHASLGVVTDGMYASNQHFVCRTPALEKLDELAEDEKIPIYIGWSKESLFQNHHRNGVPDNADFMSWLDTGFKIEFHNIHVEASTSEGESVTLTTLFVIFISFVLSVFL